MEEENHRDPATLKGEKCEFPGGYLFHVLRIFQSYRYFPGWWSVDGLISFSSSILATCLEICTQITAPNPKWCMRDLCQGMKLYTKGSVSGLKFMFSDFDWICFLEQKTWFETTTWRNDLRVLMAQKVMVNLRPKDAYVQLISPWRHVSWLGRIFHVWPNQKCWPILYWQRFP